MTDPSEVQDAPRRRASDAGPPDSSDLELEVFFTSMKRSRRDRPRYVELQVHASLLDDKLAAELEAAESAGTDTEEFNPPEWVSIFVVVTNIRLIWTNDPITIGDLPGHLRRGENDYRYPEYEVEGWLYAPHGNLDRVMWVRCSLHTNDTDEITGCIVYLLEPFEELGTDRTAFMD